MGIPARPYTVDENIIGALKMRNNYGAIKLLLFFFIVIAILNLSIFFPI